MNRIWDVLSSSRWGWAGLNRGYNNGLAGGNGLESIRDFKRRCWGTENMTTNWRMKRIWVVLSSLKWCGASAIGGYNNGLAGGNGLRAPKSVF
jgi:hypothetical protein